VNDKEEIIDEFKEKFNAAQIEKKKMETELEA